MIHPFPRPIEAVFEEQVEYLDDEHLPVLPEVELFNNRCFQN
jgi:hypothetical protein